MKQEANNLMENFIKKELYNMFKTVRHHTDYTGIIDDMPIEYYSTIREKILHLFTIFSFIGNNFENELIQKLSIDIVSFTQFVDTIGIKRQIEIFFQKYKKISNSTDDIFNDFEQMMITMMKDDKIKAIAILDTKLLYFDKLIWDKVKKSERITSYLTSMGLLNSNNTEEFFVNYAKVSPNHKDSILKIDYSVEKLNLYVEYSEDEMDLLISLKYANINLGIESNIQKIISHKEKISFFKNMQNEDISNIVKNVQFASYKPHEVIIKEDDDSKTIYFLLSGECRVSVDKINVGIIQVGQIFGEFASILQGKRTATIKANKPTALICFELAFERFEKNPYPFAFLYKNVTEELIKNINSSNKRKY
jgi:hypothetical protein